jgi:hypothetical protein
MGDRLKSAWEIALEKLEREDPQASPRPLSDGQKERIAEVRAETRARLAELEVMHKSAVGNAIRSGDAEKLAQLESEYETDRRRALEREESRVRDIREERREEES